MNEIGALSLSSSTKWRHNEQTAFYEQEVESYPDTKSASTLILGLLSIKNCEKYMLVSQATETIVVFL